MTKCNKCSKPQQRPSLPDNFRVDTYSETGDLSGIDLRARNIINFEGSNALSVDGYSANDGADYYQYENGDGLLHEDVRNEVKLIGTRNPNDVQENRTIMNVTSISSSIEEIQSDSSQFYTEDRTCTRLEDINANDSDSLSNVRTVDITNAVLSNVSGDSKTKTDDEPYGGSDCVVTMPSLEGDKINCVSFPLLIILFALPIACICPCILFGFSASSMMNRKMTCCNESLNGHCSFHASMYNSGNEALCFYWPLLIFLWTITLWGWEGYFRMKLHCHLCLGFKYNASIDEKLSTPIFQFSCCNNLCFLAILFGMFQAVGIDCFFTGKCFNSLHFAFRLIGLVVCIPLPMTTLVLATIVEAICRCFWPKSTIGVFLQSESDKRSSDLCDKRERGVKELRSFYGHYTTFVFLFLMFLLPGYSWLDEHYRR